MNQKSTSETQESDVFFSETQESSLGSVGKVACIVGKTVWKGLQMIHDASNSKSTEVVDELSRSNNGGGGALDEYSSNALSVR